MTRNEPPDPTIVEREHGVGFLEAFAFGITIGAIVLVLVLR